MPAQKGHGLQWKLFWVTLFAALAAAAAAVGAFVYAGIANRQLQTMSSTYTEIQKQTNMACLNAQAAQDMFVQALNSTGDSRAMAMANTQQAAAEIESQRAIVSLVPRFPSPNDLVENKLAIPYSVTNDGKSAALDVDLRFKAILLRSDQILHINEVGDKFMTIKHLQAGAKIPETPQPPFKPITLEIYAQDLGGRDVPIQSQIAQDFIKNGDVTAFVFGHMKYSDFAGSHTARFCGSVYVMNAGTSRGPTTPNEKTCAIYNHYSDQYAEKTKSSLPVTINPPKLIRCEEPKTN